MVIGSAQQFDHVSRDIRTGVYRGHVVTYEVIDGLAVWDGDIILGTPEELSTEPAPTPGNPLDNRNKISAVSDKERLWPGGIVPYVIDPEVENPHVPLAIRHWNENTVIQLVERTDQPNWVRFMPGSLCAAQAGMVGGEQIVTLKKYCGPADVVHEIGHTVGLYHEHQRNDRDRHVWVSPRALKIAYEQKGDLALDSGPYDYGSVMHYSWIGPLETIPPGIDLRRGGPKLWEGSDTGLSAGDIDGVNRLYGRIPTRTTVSANIAGLLIEVDGETYTAPHSFDWAPGSIHTIGVASPQKHVIDSNRYLFAKWSDGGAQTHSVTVSSETTVFIANFMLQYWTGSSVHPPEGGTVRLELPSVDGFYSRYSFVKAIAEPAEGFSFERWHPWISVHGGGHSSNPALFEVGGTRPAFFTQQPLTTIDTNVPGSEVLVDGTETQLPASFAWEAGSTHTLGSVEPIGTAQLHWGVPGWLIFNGWSDGGASTHDITVTAEPATITANFTRQVSVDTVSNGPGTITVQPSSPENGLPQRNYHALSTVVQLTARPTPGFKFVSWFGDLSGTNNPQSLLMDSYKWVRAFFLDKNTFESAKLTSGRPFNLLFGPGSARPEGYNGYWILVPPGATQLDIRLVTSTPGAEVDLYANRDIRPRAIYDANTKELVGYESQYSTKGAGGNESIIITPASDPPLEPGLYFIAVHVGTKGVRVARTLTADVTVSTEEIAANTPAFGIPASLITTREGEVPPPQSLEIRNSGRGTLDYQLATDQPWLSVSPDQGSAMEEADIIEIRADPMAMEPGVFEGEITITERQPAGGFAGLFSDHTPAWPVTVPVTFIVIPEGEEDPSDTTPTIPEEQEEGSEEEEDDSEEDEEDDSEEVEEESGGPAVEARLRFPRAVTLDAAGNLYIADPGDHRIRRVDSSGTITTIAGTGVEGYSGDGGPAVDAQIHHPAGMVVDTEGNLFFSEPFERRIRRVDSSGIITTIAGTGEEGFSGDGGPAVQAQLGSPSGVAVDAAGNLYITVITNSTIRRVDPSGTIATIAGVGRWGFAGDGGPAVQAHLNSPSDVAVDSAGNLYIADESNLRIRRVDSSGIITTIAGSGERGFAGDGGPAVEAQFDRPRGVAMDMTGNLYIADHGNHRIRKVDPSGTITTIAGTGETGL